MNETVVHEEITMHECDVFRFVCWSLLIGLVASLQSHCMYTINGDGSLCNS